MILKIFHSSDMENLSEKPLRTWHPIEGLFGIKVFSGLDNGQGLLTSSAYAGLSLSGDRKSQMLGAKFQIHGHTRCAQMHLV